MPAPLSIDALLKDALPGFEPRPAQAAMAEAVAQVLDDGGRLLVEAGTGTGKSLAYLLPALARVRDEGERMVISTHTLNLQTQLMEKDLPTAMQALGADLSVARAVGRGNYLCLLRLETQADIHGADLFGQGRGAKLERLRTWAMDEGGGLRDKTPVPVDAQTWEQIQVEAYGCLGAQCPHAQRCRFLLDRQRLQEVQVVVANHALLMADTASRREGQGLLPDGGVLVVDEAQHLSSAASSHLGLRLSRAGVLRALDRLQDPKKKRNLVDRLDRSGDLLMHLQACRTSAAALFDQASVVAGAQGAVAPGCLDNVLSQPLAGLSEALRRQAAVVKELPQGLGAATEATSLATHLDAVAESLRVWLDQDQGDSVFWVDLEGGRNPVLRSAPLDPGPLLAQELYPRYRSVVLCSATLSVQGAFAYSLRALGLEEDARTLSLAPAFDYARQVEMHLSATIPEPREEAAYLDALEQGIRAALERSLGRAFVLGTSFRHLRELEGRLRGFIEARGWLCLLQEPGARREELLNDFKSNGQAVLFGAASFWEGVDVPGEALSCVIITRLPFTVPDTPLEKARADKVKARGGEPFKDMSLPEAVLKLKQGFGRLIRHSTDRGWFVLLDPRVLTKPYGRAFLRSLPACRTFVDGEEAQLPMGAVTRPSSLAQ